MVCTYTCLWITTIVMTQMMAEARLGVIIRPKEIFRQYKNDNIFIEWEILSDDYKQFQGETYLHLKKSDTLLYVLHLFNENFDITDLNQEYDDISFSNSKFSSFGFLISDISLEDAGEYSCSNSDGGNGSVEFGKSVVTLFVYDAPESPVIRASGPIVHGNDIDLECVTKSHSEPRDHRPRLEITWYKDGIILTRNSADTLNDIAIVGDLVRLTNLGVNKVHHFNCSVQETGSKLIGYSQGFPLVLLMIETITRDIEDAQRGDDVKLIWRLYSGTSTPIIYNRTITFIHNQQELASYNMKYYQWTSHSDRITYYNYIPTEHGITIHDLIPGDIGHYACAYRDEFGTLLTSTLISLSLEGYTLAPPVTMNVLVEPYSDAETGGVHNPQGGDGDSPAVTNATGAIIGALVGALFLVLIVFIVVCVVKRKRSLKEPNSLVQRREHPENVIRYTRPTPGRGSTHSIYSTLRESLMVSDDVMKRNSPCLPPRDDTYDQPFENEIMNSDPSGKGACGQIDDAYLTMAEREPSFYNNENEKPKSCDQMSTNRNQEQNLYLMPISVKDKKKSCDQISPNRNQEQNLYLMPIRGNPQKQ